jgi:hypothetical protein
LYLIRSSYLRSSLLRCFKGLDKHSDDEIIKKDLAVGIKEAEHISREANEAVHRILLGDASEELVSGVDDWKNHRVEYFGKLLLHSSHTVITGKKDQGKANLPFPDSSSMLQRSYAKENQGHKKQDILHRLST